MSLVKLGTRLFLNLNGNRVTSMTNGDDYMKEAEKMVGFVIATHGKLASGFLDAVKLIIGEQENIGEIGLFPRLHN